MTSKRESHGSSSQLQSDKFKEAAKELDTDEDEKRWEERLKKVAKQKRGDEKPA